MDPNAKKFGMVRNLCFHLADIVSKRVNISTKLFRARATNFKSHLDLRTALWTGKFYTNCHHIKGKWAADTVIFFLLFEQLKQGSYRMVNYVL